MGDPNLEWEIVNHYPCLEEEEEEEEEEEDQSEKSKLGWILNRGLSFGKKLVMTGVVISSVPLVLPPLVVISAIGLAFSVPFGIVFASYASTEKLMAKLLPASPPVSPILMLDYDETVEDDHEELEKNERSEALKGGIEIKLIELADDDDDDNRDVISGCAEGEDYNEFLNINVEVGGLDNEVTDLLEPPSNGIGDTAAKTDYHIVGEGQNSGKDNFTGYEGAKDVINSKESDNSLLDKYETVEKTVSGMEGTETDKERRQILCIGRNETMTVFKFPGKRREILEKEETKTTSEDKPNSREKLCPKVVRQETSRDKLGSISSDKDQPGEKECIVRGSEDLDDARILARQNHNILLNDDGGNIDMSLEEETNIILGVLPNDREDYNEPRIIADDGEYFSEAAALTGKHDEGILNEQQDACGVHSPRSDDQGLFSDETIWEKLDSVRAIVGLKSPRHPQYREELKALYLFTGIKPPSSSEYPSDVVDFHDKLCSLMSVIGLKY